MRQFATSSHKEDIRLRLPPLNRHFVWGTAQFRNRASNPARHGLRGFFCARLAPIQGAASEGRLADPEAVLAA
jgi:hypothetical protein